MRVDRRKNDPLIGKRGCLIYKVRYIGYNKERLGWEPYKNIAGCLALVADFYY